MELRDILGKDHVFRCTHDLISEAEGSLEIGDKLIQFSPDEELVLISRAYVIDDSGEGFGDHLEAIVGLGHERVERWSIYRKGMLRLYFKLDGTLITEDRIPPAKN
jgi:hypothetical protein